MADGSTKRIDEVRIGDRVVATDPDGGTTRSEAVTDVIVGDGLKSLVDITLQTRDPQGRVERSSLTATDGHPFFVSSIARWVDAGHLKVGDRLNSATPRTTVVVAAVVEYRKQARVFNLTINNIHTYYVVPGSSPVLVHNVGGMEGCSDAAYQGVLHIREEIAKEGAHGGHSWAANMGDDALADYLDRFVTGGGGQPFKDGATGWYDPERGVAIIQRGAHSMTGYAMPYEDFLKKLLR